MAANRMVAKYNVEAKFTSVTAIRPRYVTQEQRRQQESQSSLAKRLKASENKR